MPGDGPMALDLRQWHLTSENAGKLSVANWVDSKQLPWIIICLGIILRCAQYLANRSLWFDESSLALNIVQRSFSQLLQPLDYDQGAPIAFLLVEKSFIQAFGNNEYILRLFPLLSGVASLVLFYKLAKEFLTPKAVPIALGLFAILDPLIYYSSEAKQYSSDVTTALILYVVITPYLEQKRFAFRDIVLFGAIGSAAIWFSHPSIFILAGTGLILFLLCLSEHAWRKIGQLSIAYSLCVLNFFLVYSISLHHLSNDRNMLDYWKGSFMPFPPTMSYSDVTWFINTFFKIFETPVGLALPGIAALTFIVGCYFFFADRKAKLFALILPIGFTLLASGLHKYPFSGRLLLFIVPSILLLIAEGVAQFMGRVRPDAAVVSFTLIGLLFFQPLFFATYDLVRAPRTHEEIKPVLNYIREHWQSGDTLYLYYSARYAFKYYKKDYGFTDGDYIVGMDLGDNWNNWDDRMNDLKRLRDARRVWILFAHVSHKRGVDEEKLFLHYFDGMGEQRDSYKTDGVAAYLYEPRPAQGSLKLLPQNGRQPLCPYVSYTLSSAGRYFAPIHGLWSGAARFAQADPIRHALSIPWGST